MKVKITYNDDTVQEIKEFDSTEDLFNFMKNKFRQWFIDFDPHRNDDRDFDIEIGKLD